jgi:hypothetical protein
MVNQFKFFKKRGTPTFQFEITNQIIRGGTQCWTREYSDAVRRWMSDLYFEDRYQNPNYHLKYIESIDRTCELIETPRIVGRQSHSHLFSVIVKIWTTNDRWMIAELSYPIDHVIYKL